MLRAMSLRLFIALPLAWFFCAIASLGKPTLFIIGDSTVRNSTEGQMGWGDPLGQHFDSSKIQVINRAIGGRSSRTFLTEGRWEAVMAHLMPGDFVLIQFGHNDGGRLNDERCRASLKGNGNESDDIIRQTDKQPETVRTYGWYLRKFIADAKSKGATPIVVSLIPRNLWTNGRIGRADKDYALWAKQAAEQERTPFIDFNSILAKEWEAIGAEKTSALFAGTDHTHTSSVGARFNAAILAQAIRGLGRCQLGALLLPDDLWLPSIYSDHMVLQRGMQIPIRGRALPGVKVSLMLGGESLVTTADETGNWSAEFPAREAGGPFELRVVAGRATKRFKDVWLGEVWLCSGQSNMDFTLAKTAKRSFSGVANWQDAVASANHPQLRMFTAEWTMSEFPQRDVAGSWAVCSPQTAGDFSAVAYYFGRAIQDNLKVPVGLITCAYGASTIESWIRQETLEAHPQFKGLLQEFGKKRLIFRDDPKLFLDYGNALANFKGGRAPRNPDPVQDQHNPFVLHHGMIAPIAPYPIRGAIWYQGESNLNTRDLYPKLQKTLIADWREQWKSAELPFYFVQLASHKSASAEPSSGQLPEMREAQAKSLSIPHTGMAVTLDIGEEKDIHPRNKLDVGRRLARLALVKTYGKSGVATGPVFREAVIEEDQIRVRFDSIGGGLVARNGSLKHFAIAGPDRNFVWAEASIQGDCVLLSNPKVKHPAYVRYAWADNPDGANLYNSEDLPAAPFRTDS